MSESEDAPIKTIDLGILSYGQALDLQIKSHDETVADGSGLIYVVEHPQVLTLGKNANAKNLLCSMADYRSKNVDIFEIDRGGEVTAHMPGQLVVYPIIPLVKYGLTVRSYVHLLEEAVIETLAHWDITAHRDADYPGVWFGLQKICALGVRVKSRVTMHGLALNVNNDLGLFDMIVPCGIQARGVTNMMKCTGSGVNLDEVKEFLVSSLSRRLCASQAAHSMRSFELPVKSVSEFG